MSKSSTERLVYMANQIAANLLQEPDPAAATAEHIRLYWDPRMKRLMQDHGKAGLTDTAAAALTLLQGDL
jgi:formate dehydrogenase subunit delta